MLRLLVFVSQRRIYSFYKRRAEASLVLVLLVSLAMRIESMMNVLLLPGAPMTAMAAQGSEAFG